MKDLNIGFIGLGNVGSKIAYNIIKNGYDLYIYDINKKIIKNLVSNGAILCNSINELIKKCNCFYYLFTLLIS